MELNRIYTTLKYIESKDEVSVQDVLDVIYDLCEDVKTGCGKTVDQLEFGELDTAVIRLGWMARTVERIARKHDNEISQSKSEKQWKKIQEKFSTAKAELDAAEQELKKNEGLKKQLDEMLKKLEQRKQELANLLTSLPKKQALAEELKSCIKEKEQLAEEIRSMMSEIEQQKRLIEKWKPEYEKLKKENALLEAEAGQKKKLLESERTKRDNLCLILERFKTELTQVQEELVEIQRQIKDVTNEITKIREYDIPGAQSELEEVLRKRAAARAEFEAKKKELEDAIKAGEEEAAKAAVILKEKEAELAAVEKKLQKAREEQAVIEKQIRIAKEFLEREYENNAQLRKLLAELEEERAKLQREQAEIEKQIIAVSDEIKLMKEVYIPNVQSELDEVLKQRAAARAEFEAKKKELEDAIEAGKIEAAQAAAILEEKEAELAAIEAECVKWREKLAAVEAQLNKFRLELENLKQTAKQAAQDAAEIMSQISKKQEEIRVLYTELQQLEEEKQRLIKVAEEAKAGIAAVQEELIRLTKEQEERIGQLSRKVKLFGNLWGNLDKDEVLKDGWMIDKEHYLELKKSMNEQLAKLESAVTNTQKTYKNILSELERGRM